MVGIAHPSVKHKPSTDKHRVAVLTFPGYATHAKSVTSLRWRAVRMTSLRGIGVLSNQIRCYWELAVAKRTVVGGDDTGEWNVEAMNQV